MPSIRDKYRNQHRSERDMEFKLMIQVEYMKVNGFRISAEGWGLRCIRMAILIKGCS